MSISMETEGKTDWNINQADEVGLVLCGNIYGTYIQAMASK